MRLSSLVDHPLQRARRRLRRRAGARTAAATIRRSTGARLVLVYHRVRPGGRRDHEVVPCVDRDRFRQQVSLLRRVGRVEPLARVLEDDDPQAPPRFAVTFDDDYATHVDHALPVLDDLEVPATFFLCGRTLQGLGAYWWERLEHLIATRGLSATADVLDLPADHPFRVAWACEDDLERQRIILDQTPDLACGLDVDRLDRLVRSRADIGFHTLHHPVLPSLDDTELHIAVREGLDRLRGVTSRPVDHFSYPHGKADRRVAAAVADAGFVTAVTTEPAPVRADDHRLLIGRWEPPSAPLDAFVADLAARLEARADPRDEGRS